MRNTTHTTMTPGWTDRLADALGWISPATTHLTFQARPTALRLGLVR